MILAFIAIAVTLILVVGIHEAGHAIAAGLFKVKIKRISIGFGKPLMTWKDKVGREWVWALWPLGGYVHLLNSRIETVPESNFTLCFDKKPIWQRCIIFFAGPLANVLIASLALTLINLLGYQQHAPLIQEIIPQSLADKAGMQANERFISINGRKTNSWQDVGMGLIMVVGKPQVPILLRNNQESTHQVNLNLEQWRYKKDDKSLLASLGIKPTTGSKSPVEHIAGQSFLQAIQTALAKVGYLLAFFFIMLKLLLTHVIPFSVLLGPLGLFSVSVSSFLQGVAVFLSFIASFSLAVGFVNLFPIPGLDGCSILYACTEKLRGKPISVAVEILLQQFADNCPNFFVCKK